MKKVFRIASAHIERRHVKFFLLYSGMLLMSADALSSWALPHFFPEAAEHLEALLGNFGKTGGALSGMSCFCERILVAEV